MLPITIYRFLESLFDAAAESLENKLSVQKWKAISVSAKVEIFASSCKHKVGSLLSFWFAKLTSSIRLLLFDSLNYCGRVVMARFKS